VFFNQQLKSGVDFTNILITVFMRADTNSAQNIVKPSVFLALLGSAVKKAVRKMLVKLTPGFQKWCKLNCNFVPDLFKSSLLFYNEYFQN